MKRFISAVLIIILLFSFSACGRKNEIVNPNEIIENDTAISVSDPKEEEKHSISEPEQTINDDENIYSEESSESFITFENGKLSGMIHPMVNTEKGGEVCKEELVSVSMSVPEGWEPGTLEEEGEIYGITFTMPWDERFETYLLVYKNDGTVYDYFYDQYSWGLKISDHTFNEVFGNFSKGVYIRVDGPSKNLGDSENWFLSSQWFYVLQFDGYVVVLHQNVRLNDDYTPFSEHAKSCNDFASSIIIN